MNVINIIGAANKLNDKQIELLKEIFVKGKYSTYKLLGRFMTLVAAGVLYKCSIESYNTDTLNSIAYAILGTHLVFKNYIIALLTATSFCISNRKNIKQCTKEINEIKDTLKK
jgi:hypothetical protein